MPRLQAMLRHNFGWHGAFISRRALRFWTRLKCHAGRQLGIYSAGLVQLRLLHLGIDQIGAGQVGVGQVRSDQVGVIEAATLAVDAIAEAPAG